MKVEIKKIDQHKRELKFEIPKERVSQTLEEVYKEIGKVAKIKGFRQGKIPRDVLEAEHGQLAQEEVIKKLIPEAYEEGIKKENIAPVDLPEIHDVLFKDGILTFTAKCDIRPEVKIKDYKGIKVKRKSSEVTEDDINKTLDAFQKSQGEGKGIQIDDTFARGLGYPNLQEFKTFLSRQLAMDKDRHNRIDVENQIVESLLSKTKVVAPPSLVKKQIDRRIVELKNRLKTQGMAEEEMVKREEEMRKELQGAVEKDIKVYFILEKIAELEGFHIHEGENLPAKVMEFLLKEANWEEAK